jgi:hypothetical protein
MAGRLDTLACSRTPVTLLLELLDKTWRDLLFLNRVALALTVRTLYHILRFVRSRASTVRTDHFSIVGHFELLPLVELLQRQSHPQLK